MLLWSTIWIKKSTAVWWLYGAALGIDELTIMKPGWIIGYLYDHQDQDTYQRDIEAEFSIARIHSDGDYSGYGEKRIY